MKATKKINIYLCDVCSAEVTNTYNGAEYLDLSTGVAFCREHQNERQLYTAAIRLGNEKIVKYIYKAIRQDSGKFIDLDS